MPQHRCCLKKVSSCYERSEHKLGVSYTLNALGNVATCKGSMRSARTLYEETLALRRELGDKRGVAATLADMANVQPNKGSMQRHARSTRKALTAL